MDSLTIGDKTYVSSKRAAEITGYAKDYIGQLCREGHVEAKMVGRSWYVLESSIRAHRFGEKEQKTGSEAPEEPPSSIPSTWGAPTYVSETVQAMPDLPERPRTAPYIDTSMHDTTISEMQSVWKEWFESRKEPLLESPEVIEAREDEHEAQQSSDDAQQGSIETADETAEPAPETGEVPVALHRIPEPQVEPEEIPVRILSPIAPPPARNVPAYSPPRNYLPSHPRRRGANLIIMALLLVIGGAAIAVGIVGTGLVDTYLENNAVTEFLGGTSTIKK